ncbi:hypothetical protein AYK24_03430 [Thermoplasmatales archaeon SG8-52-4]|nr:MAG: hypothetical protein AYK24_03430 [Thermoplasmatales archaeon SG8-52-4]
MDENERKRIVKSIDIIVAIFLILLGILVVFFSISWDKDFLNSYMPLWASITTWIFLFLGITIIIYGIKRMIQDLIL